ncbi:hypothetical protein [Novosphingobium sediminicola]|uniref:Uncharacterized protein n=1 Tax=Novosphingobium sediminicola TaxID=563162 RepID=A0A7W6CH56_9SPHN|nr:hypothetical protein [Novosphingobium sediminicola]MBB3954559.1 hypothetical protein [Novosphingobium sediminicola]
MMMKLPLIALGCAAMGATMLASRAGAHDSSYASRDKHLALFHGGGAEI